MGSLSKSNGTGQAQSHLGVNGTATTALHTVQEYGVPVFPFRLIPRVTGGFNKIPYTPHGHQDASKDPEVIERWWRKWPEGHIGVPTGEVSGWLLIDVDQRGTAWLDKNKHRLGDTLRYKTRSGGWHYLYRFPAGKPISNSTSIIADGVDVRGEGGFVAFWGAHHGVVLGQLLECPAWLLKKLRRKAPQKLNGQSQNAPLEEWAAERPRILHALAEIDPDCSYQEWCEVGMALSQWCSGTAVGEDFFVCWSRGDYQGRRCRAFAGEEAARKKYRTFKNKKDRNITLNTLFAKSKEVSGKVPEGRPESKLNGKTLHFETKKLEGLKFSSLSNIQDKDIEEKRCWIGNWLKPGAWLVVGRPKIGKGWLLMQMLMRLAKGKRFLNYETRLREGERILAVFAEDDDARLKLRADAFGKAPGNIISAINRESFLKLAQKNSDKGDFPAWLDAYLEANPQYKIIVVDTEEVSRFVWRAKELPQASKRITVVDYEQTSKFDQIALRRNCVILLVNHTNKQRFKPGESFDIHETINRTNTALAGACGSIVMADLPESDRLDPTEKRRLLGVRGRDVEDDVLIVINRTDTPRYFNEGAYHAIEQTLAEQELLKELKEWCDAGDVAPGEFVSANELAKALGKRWETVRKTVAKMLKKGRNNWNGYRIEVGKGRNGGLRLTKV